MSTINARSGAAGAGATIIVPRSLTAHTGGEAQIPVPAGTLRTVADQLRARFPALAQLLFSAAGTPLPFVSIYINGDKAGAAPDTVPVADGCEVIIVRAMAGG